QGVGIHGASRGEIKWPGEDSTRDLPAQVIEALAQLVIETDRVGNEKSGKGTASQQDRRAQQAPAQREEGSETSEQGQTVGPGSEGASLAAGRPGAAVTVCAGIADNPQPLVAWTVVLKPL